MAEEKIVKHYNMSNADLLHQKLARLRYIVDRVTTVESVLSAFNRNFVNKILQNLPAHPEQPDNFLSRCRVVFT